ncbi:uncharacterized protein LOC126659471 [Mercurialis annua]|uniref:uncharacterized protein LOC126659471 n=1 Tax=Mercurialis annua TaxID=3986 RepID=UPI002160226C|nr:uncharacterized protein LOC126659471 [Mercurialis annua]
MAPRGRPRRSPAPGMGQGQRRMDAAIDAMRGFGFADEMIFSTINELLEVYGAEGWPFIEEAAYKVLLDTILEKVENETEEKGEGGDADNVKALASGPSSSAVLPARSNEEAIGTELHTNKLLEDNVVPAMINADSAEPTDGFEQIPRPPHTGGEESSWKDISLDQASRKKETSNAGGANPTNSRAVEKLRINSSSVQRVDTLPKRQRKPCYGWLSGSDDESDIVELTPAPLPDKLAKLLPQTNVVRKNRKRRWDVRPEDK